jgi:hypothetical protein
MKKYIFSITCLLVSSLIYFILKEHCPIYIRLYCAVFFTSLASMLIYIYEFRLNIGLWMSLLAAFVGALLSAVGGIWPYMYLAHHSFSDSVNYVSISIVIGLCIYFLKRDHKNSTNSNR